MISHPRPTNRLALEKSPYLLQHAHNPVDWYPWGVEAFSKAKLEDKPIFLSIGYATCHWCHIMEKESFENPEVAALMNEVFINIKVDREELPEVDSLYMEFAQSMMSGSAGWPLNVVLTPELEPFFAATYLPPQSRPSMMGLVELVARIKEVWTSEEREKVINQASRIVEIFSENIHTQGEQMPAKEEVDHVAELFYQLADAVWGGLKGSPKFPIGYQYVFLLHHFITAKDSRSLFLVERTLDMMQRGGIYDHLGGGFSRYSVDEQWLVPHFEKMLYDNVLLMDAYLEAYRVTKKTFYRNVLDEIASYLLRDMVSPEGAFYSAEDADSEGEEGLFYTWEKDEVMKALGKGSGAVFCDYYGLTAEGNFEGRNILNIRIRLPEFAEMHQLEPSFVEEVLEEGRKKLLEIREKRERPFRDDKILSSWNGLAIHSFAAAGNALGEPRYIKAAVRAAQFIRDHLWKEGELLRRYREGDARYPAGLDEYAYMIRGLITLFEIGEGTNWLIWALEMNEILERRFKPEGGAYFQTDGEDPNLILRKIQYSDGAEPSGNAIQGENLLRLWQLTLEEKYLHSAEDILKAVKKFSDAYPPGYAYHMMNLNRYAYTQAPTLLLALGQQGVDENFLKNLIGREYIPFKAVVFKHLSDKMLEDAAPSLEIYKPVGEKTTLYICRQGACELPITEISEIQEAILKLAERV